MMIMSMMPLPFDEWLYPSCDSMCLLQRWSLNAKCVLVATQLAHSVRILGNCSHPDLHVVVVGMEVLPEDFPSCTNHGKHVIVKPNVHRKNEWRIRFWFYHTHPSHRPNVHRWDGVAWKVFWEWHRCSLACLKVAGQWSHVKRFLGPHCPCLRPTEMLFRSRRPTNGLHR